jgi:hypothetical protein
LVQNSFIPLGYKVFTTFVVEPKDSVLEIKEILAKMGDFTPCPLEGLLLPAP